VQLKNYKNGGNPPEILLTHLYSKTYPVKKTFSVMQLKIASFRELTFLKNIEGEREKTTFENFLVLRAGRSWLGGMPVLRSRWSSRICWRGQF
jgi:hypothetical protein